jgi:hypothetical protein
MAQVEMAHLLVEGHRAVSDLLRLVEVPLEKAARTDTVAGTRGTGTTDVEETGVARPAQVVEEATTVESANVLVAMSLRARMVGMMPLPLLTGETAERNRLPATGLPSQTPRLLLLPMTGTEMRQRL